MQLDPETINVLSDATVDQFGGTLKISSAGVPLAIYQ